MATKEYTLVGVDGNAFSVMGYVKKAMRQSGMSKEEANKYQNDAMRGNYDQLICLSMKILDALNNENGLTDDGE